MAYSGKRRSRNRTTRTRNEANEGAMVEQGQGQGFVFVVSRIINLIKTSDDEKSLIEHLRKGKENLEKTLSTQKRK